MFLYNAFNPNSRKYMFTKGQQIGVYTLVKKLGKGGFGEVWLAERQSQFFMKKVAIKLPLEEQVDFETIRREAELWEEASGHPNVLPIIDAAVYDGQVVIVSEYADGGSLADKLKEEGKFSPEKAVGMCIGILKGLDFLHQRKIIHRDIKPQNILLQGDTPRLADFGISRAMNTQSISTAIAGTDAYMAPETFEGKRSVQTDLWSVGVVLYQLLKNDLPFPQMHPSERMFAILRNDFEPLPDDIPQNLRWIIRQALSKQPEDRFQTAIEMREALQKAHHSISHPTSAPTEVFQKPAFVEPVIALDTAEKSPNTAEQETWVATHKPDYYDVPPTELAIQPGPYTKPIDPNNPLPTEVMKYANVSHDTNRKNFLPFIIVIGIIIGAVIVGGIALIAMNSSKPPIASSYTTSPTSTPSSSQTPTPTTPAPSRTTTPKATESPGAATGTICQLQNDSSDSVNIRSDCQFSDCDYDESTIRGSYPNGTEIVLDDTLPPVRSKTKKFQWQKIRIKKTGETGWVADTKFSCP